jgi:hypothetical protein
VQCTGFFMPAARVPLQDASDAGEKSRV